MTTVPRRLKASIAALAVVLSFPLGASGLERVGPIAPSNGFPIWYQDNTGITLDLCVPADAAEAAMCALPDVPPAGFPESFPLNWVGEHFYWTATVDTTTTAPTSTRALLVLALESTFAAEDPIPGDQIVFGRLRIRIGKKPGDIPAGLYRIYTPYGVKEFNAPDGEINQTWDIGFACAQGQFDCALQSDLDRFLLPADAPGGNELAPVTFQGRQFIADPAVPTFVTGSRAGVFNSATGHYEYTLGNGAKRDANSFIIERYSPDYAILLDETEFTVSGRLFNGTVVADAKVDRTSYAHDGNGNQVDVYATGFAARPKRIPTGPLLPEAPHPTIAFYSLPCVGEEGGPYTAPAIAPVPLARDGNTYWARELDVTLPRAICVEKNVPGEPLSFELIDPLPDQVTVTRAQYLPESRTFVVEARSSDVFDAQLAIGKFGSMQENLVLETGSANLTLPEPGVPPATLRIISNQGGVGIAEVATRLPAAPIPAASLEFTSSLTTPQLPNTSVTFTALCQGTPFPCEYQFWLFRNGAWEIVQPYSPDSTWQFQNAAAGTYQIAAWTRTSSAVEADVYGTPMTFVFQFPPPTPATGATVVANPSSPTQAAQSVTFNATGAGSFTNGAPSPQSAYQFRFFVNDGSGWQMTQDYGVGSSYTLTNPLAGTYQIGVWVRTSPDVEADYYGAGVTHVVQGPVPTPATGATVSALPLSPSQAGTDVVFSATGSGSTTDGAPSNQSAYQFRFFLNDGSGWVQVQDYGQGTTYTLENPAAGTYQVGVWVRTSTSVAADYYGAGVSHVVE